jgi:CheY-like chemotaxis protein
MNHLEVCRAVKDDAETRLVPAILATALCALEDRYRVAARNDFLTKALIGFSFSLACVPCLISRHTDELQKG